MDRKEIAELAAWTAREIRIAIKESNRELDDAGEDIIREYVQTFLTQWQRGKKMNLEALSALLMEIFMRRRHETKNEDEVMNSMLILGSKLPSFFEEHQRKRDEEAKIIANAMPVVKV